MRFKKFSKYKKDDKAEPGERPAWKPPLKTVEDITVYDCGSTGVLMDFRGKHMPDYYGLFLITDTGLIRLDKDNAAQFQNKVLFARQSYACRTRPLCCKICARIVLTATPPPPTDPETF